MRTRCWSAIGTVMAFLWIPSVTGTAWAVPETATVAPTENDQPTTAVEQDWKALVRQLGNRSFRKREEANRQLREAGLLAVDALQQGVQSSDREVRRRSEQILSQVKVLQHQRRIFAFATDSNLESHHQLPCWNLYSKYIGNDRSARLLFAAMQKAERQLLNVVEEDPATLQTWLITRAVQIEKESQTHKRQPDIGSISAMLFLASLPDVHTDAISANRILRFCYQTNFRTEMKAGNHREPLRRLLSRYIVESNDATAFQGMTLAVQFELPVGLQPAIRIIQAYKKPEGGKGQNNYMLKYAITTVAKFGTEKNLPLLTALMEDETLCSKTKLNNRQIETQVRDVALAAALTIRKVDCKKAGFPYIQQQPPYPFNSSTVGFNHDEERSKVFKKWKTPPQQPQTPPT